MLVRKLINASSMCKMQDWFLPIYIWQIRKAELCKVSVHCPLPLETCPSSLPLLGLLEDAGHSGCIAAYHLSRKIDNLLKTHSLAHQICMLSELSLLSAFIAYVQESALCKYMSEKTFLLIFKGRSAMQEKSCHPHEPQDSTGKQAALDLSPVCP